MDLIDLGIVVVTHPRHSIRPYQICAEKNTNLYAYPDLALVFLPVDYQILCLAD